MTPPWVEHVRGTTFHGRKGAVRNTFRYGIDYVLLDADESSGPSLFSRDARNLMALHDSDHGGAPGRGTGVAWVRSVLVLHALPGAERVLLLAQPRVLGHVFNPVSFWLCHDGAGALRTVVAEVTNTFGDRHSYLCHRDDQGAIMADDTLAATKLMHVSPFQPATGAYAFRFDIRADQIAVRIDYTTPGGGVVATLEGPRAPLTNAGILAACLRRPFGSRRVLALIHWQALRLAWKRAGYRARPAPPADEVSR